jgi:hypothetical protein
MLNLKNWGRGKGEGGRGKGRRCGGSAGGGNIEYQCKFRQL